MKQKGFTLIELLVVISIIAILATVVFVALNPAQRFADARNSRRWNDVNNILTAMHECIVDNAGILSACGLAAPTEQTQLGTAATGCNDDACGNVAACLDLSSELSPYLLSVPVDPLAGTAAETDYSVTVNSDGIVTVTACAAESATVQVSR